MKQLSEVSCSPVNIEPVLNIQSPLILTLETNTARIQRAPQMVSRRLLPTVIAVQFPLFLLLYYQTHMNFQGNFEYDC